MVQSSPLPESVDGGRGSGIATTVVNQKGGTGKSTLSANCATSEAIAVAEELGVDPAEVEGEILVIDMDDQCDVTAALGVTPNKDSNVNRGLDPAKHGSMALMLDEGIDPFLAVQRTKFGVDIIPGHHELNRLDASLAGEMAAHSILSKHVQTLKKRYKRILIDCPGSLGIATINALCGGDEILVPVCPGTFELKGLVRLAETVQKASIAYNLPKLRINFILITDYDKRESIAGDTMQRLQERYPSAIMSTVVPRSVRVREAPGYGEPLCVYDPSGPADLAFRAVVAEMTRRRLARA